MMRYRQWCELVWRSLLLLGTGATAFAQQPGLREGDTIEAEEELRRYTVEVILFTYDASVSSGTEVFVPAAPPAAPLDDAAIAGFDSPEIDSDVDAPILEYGDTVAAADAGVSDEELTEVVGLGNIELKVLTSEERKMSDIHEKLLRLDAYRPVLWSGWTQVVREQAETPPIPLRRLGRVPLELDGELKLYLSRFLHLVVDVGLEAPSLAVDAPTRMFGEVRLGDGYRDVGRAYDAYAPVRYRIVEDRIIKSGDIRYFDHPKFGLLAKLTRVEETEDPIDDDLSVPAAADP